MPAHRPPAFTTDEEFMAAVVDNRLLLVYEMYDSPRWLLSERQSSVDCRMLAVF